MATTYDFTDLDTGDTDHKYTKTVEVTPGDLPAIMVRRGWVDSTRQNLAAGDSGVAININAGEVVYDVYYRVITAEGTANAKIDLGFAGGTEIASDGVVTPANTIVSNVTFVPVHFAAANTITITPDNGVALDAGVFEVVACITKSFDKA